MPPYVSEGAAVRVDMDDAEALAAALARLVGDVTSREAQLARGRAFAARYLHPVDGRLTDRLLAAVAEIDVEVGTVRAERAPGGGT